MIEVILLERRADQLGHQCTVLHSNSIDFRFEDMLFLQGRAVPIIEFGNAFSDEERQDWLSILTGDPVYAVQYLCNFLHDGRLPHIVRDVVDVHFDFCVRVVFKRRQLTLVIPVLASHNASKNCPGWVLSCPHGDGFEIGSFLKQLEVYCLRDSATYNSRLSLVADV